MNAPRPAAVIAGINIRRAVGQPRVLLVALLLPVLLILVTGLVGGRVRAPVGVLLEGRGPADARLVTLLGRSGALSVDVEPNRNALTDDILRNRTVAGLVVPPGFGAPGQNGALTVGFVSQSSQSEAVIARTGVTGVLNVLAAEQLAGDAADRNAPARLTNLAIGSVHAASPLSAYSYIGPGDTVLFMGLTLLILSSSLVESRRLGMLRRVLAAPVRTTSVIVGQLGGLVVMGIVQALGLLALGRIFFGVHWGDPVGVALVVVCLAFAFAGVSTLLGTVARSYEQAIAAAIVLGIAGGMLGGSLWSLDNVGTVMRDVGHATPQAWAMDGFVSLVYDHSGTAGVIGDAAALIGFAVLFCSLAAWRLRAACQTQ